MTGQLERIVWKGCKKKNNNPVFLKTNPHTTWQQNRFVKFYLNESQYFRNSVRRTQKAIVEMFTCNAQKHRGKHNTKKWWQSDDLSLFFSRSVIYSRNFGIDF